MAKRTTKPAAQIHTLIVTICPACKRVTYAIPPTPTLTDPDPPAETHIDPNPLPNNSHTIIAFYHAGITLHRITTQGLHTTLNPADRLPKHFKGPWHPPHTCNHDPTNRHPADHPYAPGAPTYAYHPFPAHIPGLTPEQARLVINTLNPPPY